ncbi:ArfGAP with FG repeats 1 [Kappamyces sp. JEL0680]|nr:ArfGAP with FG repeats 1 [Kappamyces sp. JEL0680]
MTKLRTFVCADCAGILREMNLQVKSITSSTFSSEELLKIKNTDYSILERLIMGKYDPSGKYPLPNKTHSLAYNRSFIYAKYAKKKWFDEEALSSDRWGEFQGATAAVQHDHKPPEGVSADLLSPLSLIDHDDTKPHDLANPDQFNHFGAYQNIHTASAPDSMDGYREFKSNSSFSAPSFTAFSPPKTDNSSNTARTQSNGSFTIPTKAPDTVSISGPPKTAADKDPYAAFKTLVDDSASIFSAPRPLIPAAAPTDTTQNEKRDPYAALKHTELFNFNPAATSTTSIWDSHSSTRKPSLPLPTPANTPGESPQPAYDDDFGDFESATLQPATLLNTPSASTPLKKSSANLLDACKPPRVLTIY